jgi:3-hydroxyacyl-[acyl-carrier-protein] dehydratase
MILTKVQIENIQQNRGDYLFVDEILNVDPGVKIHALKKLSKDNWFFKLHWPNDPNLPAMLQLECMSQASAMIIQCLDEYKNQLLYVTSVDKALFKQKVTPYHDLEIFAEVRSFKRGIIKTIAHTKFNDKIASSSEITMVIPSIIKKIYKK